MSSGSTPKCRAYGPSTYSRTMWRRAWCAMRTAIPVESGARPGSGMNNRRGYETDSALACRPIRIRRCHRGAGARVVRRARVPGAVPARRGPLRRNLARDAGLRRLDHAEAERPEVFRETAAAVLGHRGELCALRRRRMEGAVVDRRDGVPWRARRCVLG